MTCIATCNAYFRHGYAYIFWNLDFMKITKKFLLFFMLLFGVFQLKAQETTVDARLVDFYGIEHINRMKQSAPGTIEYLSFYVSNAYTIIKDLPDSKLVQFENISSIKNRRTNKPISSSDLDNLNILELGIKRKGDQHLTYRIDNTNDVIVFIAPDEVRRRYNEEVKR